MSKNLQLQRNDSTILSKRNAIIEEFKNSVSADTENVYDDGQVFVIRYTDDTTNEIGAAICTVNIVNGEKHLNVSDCDLYDIVIKNKSDISTLKTTIGTEDDGSIKFPDTSILKDEDDVKSALLTLESNIKIYWGEF